MPERQHNGVDPQEFGELKAAVAAIHEDQKAIKQQLIDLSAYMHESKGAWKMFLLTHTAAGAIGAGFTKALSFLSMMGK